MKLPCHIYVLNDAKKIRVSTERKLYLQHIQKRQLPQKALKAIDLVIFVQNIFIQYVANQIDFRR